MTVSGEKCASVRGKQFGCLRQFKLRGRDKVSTVFGLYVIAYNLTRLGNILKPAMEVA